MGKVTLVSVQWEGSDEAQFYVLNTYSVVYCIPCAATYVDKTKMKLCNSLDEGSKSGQLNNASAKLMTMAA